MTKCEILIKAIEVLNKQKGTNFQLSKVKEDDAGGVDCWCVFPSGHAQDLCFVSDWFDENWSGNHDECPYISAETKKKIATVKDQETRVIMCIIDWFWRNRNLSK